MAGRAADTTECALRLCDSCVQTPLRNCQFGLVRVARGTQLRSEYGSHIVDGVANRLCRTLTPGAIVWFFGEEQGRRSRDRAIGSVRISGIDNGSLILGRRVIDRLPEASVRDCVSGRAPDRQEVNARLFCCLDVLHAGGLESGVQRHFGGQNCLAKSNPCLASVGAGSRD